MNKHNQYVAAVALAIQVMDTVFVRANAAEEVRPVMSMVDRWRLPDDLRADAEQAEVASYDVTPQHWGARLALMSAFESLQAALRIVSSTSAPTDPGASAWRDATAHADEASRLAQEARSVLADHAAGAAVDARSADAAHSRHRHAG